MSYIGDWLFDTLAQARKDIGRVVEAITPKGGIYGSRIKAVDYTNEDCRVVVMKPINDEERVLVALDKTRKALEIIDEAIVEIKRK